jgi:hypothetical protein
MPVVWASGAVYTPASETTFSHRKDRSRAA